MNRGRGRFQGRSRGRGNASSVGHQLLTVPYIKKNLPLDPPTIRSNPPRECTLIYKGEATSEATPHIFTGKELTTLMDYQLGTTSSRRFYVSSAKAWAAGAAEVELTLSDPTSWVSGSDAGSYTQRAKVGIMFPPHTRRFYGPTDPIVEIKCIAAYVLYVNCTVWNFVGV